MEWRLAHSLEKLRTQLNARWPDRSKDSDGSIGDASHASRSSDHNPWISDAPGAHVVSAIDITHDPAHGFDSYAFADMLLHNKDPRIKYAISNRRIGSGSDGPQPWTWRHYSGTSPHDHHVHISVKSDKVHYDSVADWILDSVTHPMPVPDHLFIPPLATLRKGSTGEGVKRLQAALHVFIDGQFGPATEKALKVFQTGNHLVVDGVCGPATWKALGLT